MNTIPYPATSLVVYDSRYMAGEGMPVTSAILRPEECRVNRRFARQVQRRASGTAVVCGAIGGASGHHSGHFHVDRRYRCSDGDHQRHRLRRQQGRRVVRQCRQSCSRAANLADEPPHARAAGGSIATTALRDATRQGIKFVPSKVRRREPRKKPPSRCQSVPACGCQPAGRGPTQASSARASGEMLRRCRSCCGSGISMPAALSAS